MTLRISLLQVAKRATYRRFISRLLGGGLACLLLGLAITFPLRQSRADDAADRARALEQPAHFRVTTETLNPNVGAFATSVAGLGNSISLEAGSFEPPIFQNALIALKDSEDDVFAAPDDLTHWDIYRENIMQGAEVRVYRVINGEMREVRVDHVAADGAHTSGWLPVVGGNAIIPGNASEYLFRLDDWNRPEGTYYFALAAVDAAGRESPLSSAVSVTGPPDPGKAARETSALAQLNPSRIAGLLTDPPPAPLGVKARVRADGMLQLTWNGARDQRVTGYHLYRSDYPPESHRGYFLHLQDHAHTPEMAIRKGDWVFLRRKIYQFSRKRDLSNRIWNVWGENSLFLPRGLNFFPDEKPGVSWELVPHEQDSPVEDGGETCLKLTLAAGQQAAIEIFNHSGTGTDWYDVLPTKPHTFAVWLKQEGTGNASFHVRGDYEQPGQQIPQQPLRVGNRWKLHFGTFTPPVVLRGDRANSMSLDFTGPGTFYIDNFRIWRSDAKYLTWLPEDLQALRASGVGSLRTHIFIKSGLGGYDLNQFTNPGGVGARIPKLDTLPQTLAAMKAAGVNPWLQIDPYFSDAEWRGLLEYLAAPFDPARDTPASRPWAFKRFSQGHAAPWTDDFPEWHLELGNETWNQIFVPWVFPGMTDARTRQTFSSGAVYGLFQERVIRLLKATPWWSAQQLSGKFHFVIGGWNGFSYGQEASRTSPSSDLLTIAAYNGGWDAGKAAATDTLESYFDVLTNVPQEADLTASALEAEAIRLNAGRKVPLRLGTYEAGPGYVLNGLNGAHMTHQQDVEQDRVMKSLAAGVATLDAFLNRAAHGFVLQNFFGFSRGGKWGSHARWFEGGQAWPSWKLISLFNQQGTGTLLRTETVSVPTWPFGPTTGKAKPAPMVAAYALRRGQRVMLFLLSRKMPFYPVASSTGVTPTTVVLPFRKFSSARVYRSTAAYNANNLTEDAVRIEDMAIQPALADGQLTVATATGGREGGLAPGSFLLYVFEGTDMAVSAPARK